jgi:type VI secretion system protein
VRHQSFLSLIASCLILSSCSSSDEISPELSVSDVTIYAEPDANLNSAIAVDVVLIYDNDLLGSISKMPASKYFEASNQLRLDNPSLLDVWRWELVPGQVVNKFSLNSDKGDAFGGIVFANYLTPGDHRVKIPPSGEVKILLQKNDLMSVAEGSFDGLNVGKTASEAVPNGKSNSAMQATKKLPCGNPLTEPSPSRDGQPGGFVLTQHQTIQVSPLDDGVGKDRNELPRQPLQIQPSCGSGGCSK